jgi:release factor glutamine methyltransferase
VVVINAALQDAISVSAFDICRRAVHCARANALAAGVDVDVHPGSWARAVEFGPFDLVVCNPPYVPDDSSVKRPPAAVHDWTAACVGRRLRGCSRTVTVGLDHHAGIVRWSVNERLQAGKG